MELRDKRSKPQKVGSLKTLPLHSFGGDQMKKAEGILSLLSYLSGVSAVIIYFLTKSARVKAHAYQGMVLAAVIWSLDVFSGIFSTFLRPLYDLPFGFHGNILSVASTAVYYFAVLLGLLALAGNDVLLFKESEAEGGKHEG